MTTKTILVRDWRKMETHAMANETHGRQKIDEDGEVWEWVRGGKRIHAKLVAVIKWNKGRI